MANLLGAAATLAGLIGGATEPDPPPINPSLGGAILSWTDKKSGQTLYVHFDVSTTEHHEYAVEITKHPVEEGSDVVDHARPEPAHITIQGYVSNKPLPSNLIAETVLTENQAAYNYLKPVSQPLDYKGAGAGEAASTLTPTPGGLTRSVVGAIDSLVHPMPSKAQVYKGTDMPNRARDCFKKLKDAQQARVLIRVETSMQELTNMLITRLSVPRAVEDGNGANIEIDLEQIRIVKSETVGAPTPVEARGAPSKSEGNKNPEKADDKKDSKRKTAAKQLADKAGKFASAQLKGLLE